MPGNFTQRMAKLESDVGDGDLVMGSIVGQAYAAAQHNKNYRHPRGGMMRYLEVPFMEEHDEMLAELAMFVITENGSQIRSTAIRIAQVFDRLVQLNAPFRKDILRDSTNTYVTDGGRTIFATIQRDPRLVEKQ